MKTESAINPRSFYGWLVQTDRILRGDATRIDQFRRGELEFPVLGVTLIVILLGAFYGLCMGVYAMIHGMESDAMTRAGWQTFASICKVPLLFMLTLVVTFPSLYVFNALIGSRLRIGSVLKLLVASLVVNLCVLASMGPILAFFSASTPSYPFIVLLNVAIFSVAGGLGLAFLLQTLSRLDHAMRRSTMAERTNQSDSEAINQEPGDPVTLIDEPSSRSASPLDTTPGIAIGRNVKHIFTCWIVLFGVVGAQMGWILRPFIGSPKMEFQWFRARDSNFFEAVFNTFWNLFG